MKATMIPLDFLRETISATYTASNIGKPWTLKHIGRLCQ